MGNLDRDDFTGAFLVPAAALGDLVAASTTYQTLVSAEDADEAWATLIWFSEDPDAVTRPLCLIDWIECNSLGFEGLYRMAHDFLVVFEFVTPVAYQDSTSDACVWMTQKCGAIVAEMREAQDSLLLHSITKHWGPARSDKKEWRRGSYGDYVQMALKITAGVA